MSLKSPLGKSIKYVCMYVCMYMYQYCLQSPSLILKADEFYISLNLVPSSQQQYLAEVGLKNRNHVVHICCSYCGIGYTRFIR